MRTINMRFTDDEFKKIKKLKDRTLLTWEHFLMMLLRLEYGKD